ncbi:tryptophan--tRNA ligase [Candidatus Microgenomates bacterium]|nr:tryptophan--tRNA ligase [Candidatus Microgenomates bacterium]
MAKRILTGIKPTEDLHIGNYLGTLINWSKYIKEGYECYFFVADYHSLTANYDPKKKYSQILTLTAEILALGVDPKKCVFFQQSAIPEHTELMWYFNCLTPVSFLERMTQYKDALAKKQENANVGLFTYPTLMAADILLYDTDIVPVGMDQVQHLELARDVARFFNNRFGKIFKEPQPKLTESAKVMSLVEPEKKMSKSGGEKSIIFLADEPRIVAEKFRKATTDEKGLENLRSLAKVFMKDFDAKNYANNNLKLKEDLAKGIADHFATFRKKRKELLAKPKYLEKILADGAKKAKKIAEKKILIVRKKVGVR